MMKKKKMYVKPAMQMYELQHQAPIICISGELLSEPDDYNKVDDPPFTF